jgi:hypothetical protein
MVEFDPVGSPGTYINWCGAKNFSLNIENEIQNEKVGDCADWSLPVVTQKEYSSQTVTATMDATWTAATHKETGAWALEQKTLKVRVHFPNALTGEVEYYDGDAMLSGLSLAEIGNVDGNKVSENVSLEFDGTLTVTTKA